MSESKVTDLSVATVEAELPAPVVFGDWIMRTREFVVVRITLDSGVEGWAFTLSRDGAVAEHIRKTLRNIYVGTLTKDVESTFRVAQRRSLASHSAGVGLRALSLADLALWDARSKEAGQSISKFLKGSRSPMPATAIIGYPPATMGPEEDFVQVKDLYSQGWRRFKAPVGINNQATAERLKAARKKTGMNCGIMVVKTNIKNINLTAIASDFNFIGGSIGAAEGEAFLTSAITPSLSGP